MKEKEIKPKKFYQKKWNIFIALGIITITTLIVLTLGSEETSSIRTETIKLTELIQEVSITGSVKPADEVSLGFEISGKVENIFADVGNVVAVGDKLISLSNNDILAQLRQAQAGASSANAMTQQYQAALDAQHARLNEMKSGTRPEELQIAKTNVLNSQGVLEDAKRNLDITINKSETDINSLYNNTLLSLQDAVIKVKKALIILTNIQYAYFRTSNQDRYLIESAKKYAIYSLFEVSNAGTQSADSISRMTGGIYGEVQNLGISSSHEEIEEAINNTLNALQKIKFALNVIPIKIDITDSEILSLDTEKSSINSQITAISNQRNQINIKKISNDNIINIAKTEISNAQNAINTAKDQLKLKEAGYTKDQIKAQEALVDQAYASLASQKAQVNQAYANVQNYQVQLDKTILYAPIDGLVTKMEAKVGEIVFPSSPYSDNRTTFVSIISEHDYEIEARVAEVDIAKINVGDSSKVTLDAYGDDILFEAKITAIDPAETIIEGIPTYKVTLQIINETEKIKSGMTANLDILTNKLEDVISIPQRAVISKNNKKIVRVLKENSNSNMSKTSTKNIVDIEVKTGIKGSNGRIEIIEGLNVGDAIVISNN